jgi:hypothetical protein
MSIKTRTPCRAQMGRDLGSTRKSCRALNSTLRFRLIRRPVFLIGVPFWPRRLRSIGYLRNGVERGIELVKLSYRRHDLNGTLCQCL